MESLLPLAEKIAARLIERRETISVAEGSAGGLISAAHCSPCPARRPISSAALWSTPARRAMFSPTSASTT